MSTEALGASLKSSLALVGMLGFRHGFDADHIAIVDGMTRARQLQHSYWTARGVGLQFALGHSAVIGVASLLLYGQSAALPRWLDGLGLAVSTCLLLVIAASNFGHALRPASAAPAPIGPIAALLLRSSGGNLNPALVGMAFAMSFDSMAQAAFFASRGSAFSGIAAVALMAGVFGMGMTLADAANGALLNWFTSRSDGLARQASRISSGFIAMLALLAAVAGLWRELRPGFAQVWDDMGGWIGAGLVGLTTAVYVANMAWHRAREQAAGATRWS